jgi:hypothetical protein
MGPPHVIGKASLVDEAERGGFELLRLEAEARSAKPTGNPRHAIGPTNR